MPSTVVGTQLIPSVQGPIDREEAIALRRQECVNPRRLQRPRPPLLKRGGDAGLARATRAIEHDASRRHRSRIPHDSNARRLSGGGYSSRHAQAPRSLSAAVGPGPFPGSYYEETHLPSAAKFPGLRGYRYSFDVAAAGEGESPYYCVFEADFDDAAALECGAGIPRGSGSARGRLPNYATGGCRRAGLRTPLRLSQGSEAIAPGRARRPAPIDRAPNAAVDDPPGGPGP